LHRARGARAAAGRPARSRGNPGLEGADAEIVPSDDGAMMDVPRERRMTGLHFWAAGYCVSTVGLDEARVRQYIREQEQLERRQGEFDFE
jgi:hypothetical protein